MIPAENQITKLYVGYFDRAPDPAGFNFWVGQASAGGAILDIANSFAAGQEYASIYGGLSNGSLIDKIYDNLFGRAPDDAGKAYWVAQLESGLQAGSLIVNVMSGAQGNDRITLENTAIVARDWTATDAHIPFTLEAGRNAIGSIGKIEGNGVTIKFSSDVLLPFQNQLTLAMQQAWAQWGNHGMLDVDLRFLDTNSNVLAFAYAKNELLTGQTDQYGTPVTQSNVGLEVNTGKDMNGDMVDITITIGISLDKFFLYDTTSILAHEIGHGLGFRTEAFDFDSDYSTITSWDQFLSFPAGTNGPVYFNGPEAMVVYGGPVPITGYYNSTHPDGIGSIMDPTFGQGAVRFVGLLDKAMMHDIGVFI